MGWQAGGCQLPRRLQNHVMRRNEEEEDNEDNEEEEDEDNEDRRRLSGTCWNMDLTLWTGCA